MIGHPKSKKSPGRVGLDIGSHTVCGVEVVERASDTVVRSAGSAVINGLQSKTDSADTSEIVRAIKNLWSSARFDSRRVVLALPSSAVYMKWLHLEAVDEEELEQTAQATAARGAPFPADDAIVDYRVLSRHLSGSRNIYHTLLVAASGTLMDHMLNIVEGAGLEPIAVDIGVAAAVRSACTQKRAASPLWSGQPSAHAIMGAKNTTITVIRENAPEFARTVPVGGNDFTERIAEHAKMGWAEAEKLKLTPGTRLNADGILVIPGSDGETKISCEQVVGRLAREIQRSLKFFKSQYAEGSYLGMIGAITVSGGAALLKGLDSCLQSHGVEINGQVNPFTGYSVSAEGSGVHAVGESAASYITAMGLATGLYQ